MKGKSVQHALVESYKTEQERLAKGGVFIKKNKNNTLERALKNLEHELSSVVMLYHFDAEIEQALTQIAQSVKSGHKKDKHKTLG